MENIFPKMFPCLFPSGRFDPCNAGRVLPITEREIFEHLMNFADTKKDSQGRNKWSWRFAKHPYFKFVALNRLNRHQRIKKVDSYIDRHPRRKDLTRQEIEDMIESGETAQLLQELHIGISEAKN